MIEPSRKFFSPTFFEHPSRRWLAVLAVSSIVAIAAQPMPFPFPSIASLGLAAIPLILAFRLRAHPRTDLRAAWDIVAIGLSAWWLADLTAILIAIIFPAQASERSIADFIRLVGYMLIAFGIWRYPVSVRTAPSRSLRVLIDIILTIGSATAIFYDLKFRDVLETTAPLGERIWESAYPLFGLFVIVVASVVILRTPVLGVSTSWFVLAIGSVCAVSLTMIGGQLLIGIAAVIAEALNEHDSPQPGSRRARLTLLAQRLLPVMAVLALFAETIIAQIALARVNEIGLFLAILFSSLLVVRQGMLLGENEFQRYAQLVNSASDAAFICRKNGQMVLANPAAYNLLNLSHSASLRNQFLADAFQPASLEENRQLLIAASEGGWYGEGLAFLRANPITLSLVLNALRDEAGAVNGLVGIARDITERQHMDSKLRSLNVQLLEAQDRLLRLNADLEKRVAERTTDLTDANRELEQKNLELQTLDQLKSEFVSLVSHELRAPLTNINGGLELLLSKDGGMSLDSREALTLMSHEARRLTRLVEAILDLSTFDAGQLPISISRLSLHPLITSVVEQFQAGSSLSRLSIDVPPALPRALADERGLRSSLTQLVDNALKYAPKSSIEILARCEEDHIELRVADHGPGITSEHREKVFERFHRVNPSDSQNVYGYGLGLHTTRRFIEAMDGAITFEETPGGGSTFCIQLKVAP